VDLTVLYSSRITCLSWFTSQTYHPTWTYWTAPKSHLRTGLHNRSYLGMTLDTQFTWSAHFKQIRKKSAQGYACLGPLLTRKVTCSSETVSCSASNSPPRPPGTPLPAMSKSCKSYSPSAFPLLPTHLGTVVTGKFSSIWGFHSSPTASEHWARVSTQTTPMRGIP
jgi:hypothetical protein